MKIFLSLIILFSSLSAYAGYFAVTLDSQQTVTATTASTKFLELNPLRTYLLIQNNGAVAVYVKFGSAQSGNEGVVIAAGGNYEPYKTVYDAIYMKSASSTASVTIIEGH